MFAVLSGVVRRSLRSFPSWKDSVFILIFQSDAFFTPPAVRGRFFFFFPSEPLMYFSQTKESVLGHLASVFSCRTWQAAVVGEWLSGWVEPPPCRKCPLKRDFYRRFYFFILAQIEKDFVALLSFFGAAGFILCFNFYWVNLIFIFERVNVSLCGCFRSGACDLMLWL